MYTPQWTAADLMPLSRRVHFEFPKTRVPFQGGYRGYIGFRVEGLLKVGIPYFEGSP